MTNNTLEQLIDIVRQRNGLENSQFITDAEIANYIETALQDIDLSCQVKLGLAVRPHSNEELAQRLDTLDKECDLQANAVLKCFEALERRLDVMAKRTLTLACKTAASDKRIDALEEQANVNENYLAEVGGKVIGLEWKLSPPVDALEEQANVNESNPSECDCLQAAFNHFHTKDGTIQSFRDHAPTQSNSSQEAANESDPPAFKYEGTVNVAGKDVPLTIQSLSNAILHNKVVAPTQSSNSSQEAAYPKIRCCFCANGATQTVNGWIVCDVCEEEANNGGWLKTTESACKQLQHYSCIEIVEPTQASNPSPTSIDLSCPNLPSGQAPTHDKGSEIDLQEVIDVLNEIQEHGRTRFDDMLSSPNWPVALQRALEILEQAQKDSNGDK